MKAIAQILHITFLILSSVLLLLFFRFSDADHDKIRTFIDICFYVIAGSWSTTVFVSLLLNKDVDSKTKIISIYKALLVNNLFLYSSTVILLVFNLILLYQLVFFRQVEFRAAGPAVIKIRFASGDYVDLTEVGEDGIVQKRLRVQDEPYRLVSIAQNSGEIATQKLVVQFYWEDSKNLKCFFNE